MYILHDMQLKSEMRHSDHTQAENDGWML